MNLGMDELGALKEFVRRELLYYKTFEGIVIDTQDDLGRGRIKVRIPEIGWSNISTAPWVEPEIQHGQITPLKDVAVCVYFLNGDISSPLYRGRTPQLRASRLPAYEDQFTVVLFQDDGDDPFTVLYRRNTKTLEITMGKGGIYKQVINTQDKKMSVQLDKCTLSTDGSKWTIDADGNQIVHESGKTTVSGNLEVSK